MESGVFVDDCERDDLLNRQVENRNEKDGEDEDKLYLLTEEQKTKLDLEDDTIQAIQDVFRSLDEDSSGYLDVAELETAMKSMGVECSKHETDALIKQIDVDGNGSVDIFEFAQMVSKKLKEYDPESELREAFAVFDQDGDGRVGMDEIQSVVDSLGGNISAEEVQQMLQEADENNDGYIDYEEFVKVWLGSGKGEIAKTEEGDTLDTEMQNNDSKEENEVH